MMMMMVMVMVIESLGEVNRNDMVFQACECQVRRAASATLTRRAWMDVTSCAVEGDITPSRKGEVIRLYNDNDEDRSDDDFMSHA